MPRMKSGCDLFAFEPTAYRSERQSLARQLLLVLRHAVDVSHEGRLLEGWNDHVHPTLVGQQIQTGRFAGSWDPLLPVPDRWGPQAGRMYVTTLNLLSLEVYYRHLPIYEQTAK